MAPTYRHFLPGLDLSIEQNTENVSQDNFFYLMKEGAVIGRYRYLRKAEEVFRTFVKESGYVPPKLEAGSKSASELSIERYMDNKELYWAESHRFRGRGGKGGRGGV